MANHPGAFSTIFTLVSIAAYLLADIFALILIQVLIDDPAATSDPLGNLVATVFALVYVLVFGGIGFILGLIGQVWKQRQVLVVISLLTFSFFGVIFIYAMIPSILAGEVSSGLYLLIPLFLNWIFHAKGLMGSSDEVTNAF